jgi:hypothetical protein
MKVYLCSLAALISFPVFSAPFVVSDVTSEAVTSYLCSVDGGADQVSVPEAVTGGVRVKFDIAGLTVGGHTITCKAANPTWGMVSTASLPLSVSRPPSTLAVPKNLTVVP